MENVYVLAGSQREALQFMWKKGRDTASLRYIHREEYLRGVDGRGKTLICTGTYWKREDYARIRDCADVRGFTIREED